MNKSAKFAPNLIKMRMALSDIKKLADYAMQNEDKVEITSMEYDSGRASMVYARGNILLGKRCYVKTLKIGKLRRLFVAFLDFLDNTHNDSLF